jgi:hypothetical protein
VDQSQGRGAPIPFLVLCDGKMQAFWQERKVTITAVYVLLLFLASARCIRSPFYQLDILGYMGNAVLIEDRDPIDIHQRVYAEAARDMPRATYQDMTGQLGGSDDLVRSKQDRARDPWHFAEYLPFFAIRPIYNQALYFLSKSGLRLVRAAILISTTSYILIGLILFVWLSEYVAVEYAAVASLLIMVSPPVTFVGRFAGSDALAALFALFSLFLIFEKQKLTPGLALLLASVFVRTDNVVVAGLTLLACVMQKRIKLWQGGVLAFIALGSALMINHAAGDYGIRMLYFRNFMGTPLAPAENPVQFSPHDYVRAFREGLSNAADGVLIPFLLLAAIGLAKPGPPRTVLFIATGYVAIHFIVLPNWQDRWFCLLYLTAGIAAVRSAAGQWERLRAGRVQAVSHS